MQSPLHPDVELVRDSLADGPPAWRCPASGGVWIDGTDYQAWRERHWKLQEPEASPGEDMSDSDSPAGKRCPVDGRFLIRHQVGHGLDFHIDLCNACGGLWLDAGEWQALRARDLQDDLTRVFTSAWQAALRRERAAQAERDRLKERLGAEDFERFAAFVDWLDAHPHRSALLAYLRSPRS